MRPDAPSATACLIAASTLYMAGDPRAGQLIPARAAELSERFLGGHSLAARWAHRVLRSVAPRVLACALERVTIPGIQLHYALRKLYLEGVARAALSDGIRQVVILGAGYDTLALRLHEEFPAAQFIEMDHPATQLRKTRALACRRRDGEPKDVPNLHFLPLDLTRRELAPTLLGFEGYSTGTSTLFIAEGLLMYLSSGEVDELFRAVRDCCRAQGRFAFTFMEPQADGRVNFRTRSRVVNAWLGSRREVFKWGIPRSELASYLSARGFAVREMATDETLRRRYLRSEALARLPLAAGEYLCVADLEKA